MLVAFSIGANGQITVTVCKGDTAYLDVGMMYPTCAYYDTSLVKIIMTGTNYETAEVIGKNIGTTSPECFNVNDYVMHFTITVTSPPCPGTGVEGVGNSEVLEIFPNPAKLRVKVTLPNSLSGILTISLLTDTGIPVLRYSTDVSTFLQNPTIDVSKLPAGIYLLQLSSATGSLYGKVVKAN